jgi:hypothetical protein
MFRRNVSNHPQDYTTSKTTFYYLRNSNQRISLLEALYLYCVLCAKFAPHYCYLLIYVTPLSAFRPHFSYLKSSPLDCTEPAVSFVTNCFLFYFVWWWDFYFHAQHKIQMTTNSRLFATTLVNIFAAALNIKWPFTASKGFFTKISYAYLVSFHAVPTFVIILFVSVIQCNYTKANSDII